jgi:hypothetical protein
MALTQNTTLNEQQAVKSLRANFQAEQDRRRAAEQAIAAAHRNAAGPEFSSGTESQSLPEKPVIRRPGSAI